jgi:type I restriction enzyme S subunit
VSELVLQSDRPNWHPTRLKYLFQREFSGVWDNDPDGGTDDIVCVRVADFDRHHFVAGANAETIRSVPPSRRIPRLLLPGDVLLEKSGGSFDKPVGCSVSFNGTDPAVCSNFIAVLRPTRQVDRRYAAYLMAALYMAGVNEPFVKQTTGIQNLDSHAYLGTRVDVPSLAEQSKLVTLLDEQTGRIDALITEQSHVVDLLWERRRASVFDAVTGLSELGPRSQRVPWVDSIPSAWEAAKLSSVASLGSGHTPARSRPELWMDCTVPWITTGEVWQIRSDEVDVLTDTREMISQRGIDESSAVLHPAGTVVLSRTASAGFSAIMGSDMATSQDFATWTCGPKLLPKYLLYCLRAMRSDLLGRLAMGSTHQTIYMPEIKSIVVPLPPLDTQNRIISELCETVRELDVLRNEMEGQIALLRERRRALIIAVVTGQFDLTRSAV